MVAVPIGRAILPYTSYNNNWEGVGIVPHIEIASEQALDKAKLLIKQNNL